MPFLNAPGARLYYRLDGREDRPVLVLSHALGTDHGLWDPQMAALVDHFRVLRCDTRGHGASDAPAADYTIELLARDVLAAVGALGIEQFAFCGLSLGGMIGQWLAAHVPDRVTRLVLANTSPCFPDPSVMEARRTAVLAQGMTSITDAAIQRFFLPETVAAGSAGVDWARRTLLATNPTGYAGCCAAIRDMDQTGLVSRIVTPTLLIVGERDASTPWEGHGEKLADGIAGCRIVRLPTAHLSNLEQPRSFTADVLEFLVPHASDEYAAGMAMRRAVLGNVYVDRATAGTTVLNRDFQELITRYAWGTVWSRPGLDVRTRRLLVLATTAALGRWEEFRLHVKSGLAGELELCDAKEVLLHVAVYAGVPAANTAFHILSEESRG
jgi:3-oxoadipate enol-lactonase/4-carboxymuconolactone decarboxylase